MIHSVINEAQKKRIDLQEISSLSEVNLDSTCVLLLGASQVWIESMADKVRKIGLHPVALSNRQMQESNTLVSTVTMDVHGAMKLAIDYLKSINRNRIALYGINPNSSSDPWRVERFEAMDGQNEDVYFINDTLEETFCEFYKRIEQYDAVVCASDYAAVSLLYRLKQKEYPVPEKLYIVSFGNMKLSQLTKPSITSISDAYDEFGMAALSLCNLIEKNDMISNATIYLHCKLYVRETTENRTYDNADYLTEDDRVLNNWFYEDPEIKKLAALENLFCQSDDIDQQLIRLITEKKSYAQIAQECFISESAVKYRIRKMEKICNVDSREALIKQLNNFFSPGN